MSAQVRTYSAVEVSAILVRGFARLYDLETGPAHKPYLETLAGEFEDCAVTLFMDCKEGAEDAALTDREFLEDCAEEIVRIIS